jgi:hypothetical protein
LTNRTEDPNTELIKDFNLLEKIMSFKTLLGIALALIITFFVLFSFNWKTKEQSHQIEYSQNSQAQTDIVDKQTDRMISANSQAGSRMETGDKPTLNPSAAPSDYIPSEDKTPGNDTPQLKLSHTYSIKAGDYFACSNVYLLRRLLRYDISGETEHFNKLLNKNLSNGNCIKFRHGEAVLLGEISADEKEIKVSRFGDSKFFWTTAQAIR